MNTPYRGRLAPSPTGWLHVGHARTFWAAWERSLAHAGTLILRNEDLDQDRCRRHFAEAMLEDLAWLGIRWSEGPDRPGSFGPYSQSERQTHYRAAWATLRQKGLIYPCRCSRRDVQQAAQAPHEGTDEPVYPGTCRPPAGAPPQRAERAGVAWRFRMPEGAALQFHDACQGQQEAVAGRDIGDFIAWRKDDVPAYQLAVVVDDLAMRITEVVRGADLLLSTFRQILLFQALGGTPPRFYHAPLVCDAEGRRLAKRHDALSLRALRAAGVPPRAVLEDPLEKLLQASGCQA